MVGEGVKGKLRKADNPKHILLTRGKKKIKP
jgi:hypothetical protein